MGACARDARSVIVGRRGKSLGGVDLAEQTGRGDEVPRAPEGVEERLKAYGLHRFVKALPTMEPTHDDIPFDPARNDVKQFYLHVPVESLADLKLWTGLPNDHIDHTKYRNHLKRVKEPALTSVVGSEILDVVEQQVVADAEFNLLFGYVDEELLRNAFWMAVAHGLLERVKDLHILHLQDLVVQDGQRVTISNTPTAFFQTITVYGSGVIDFRSGCKVIADTISHVPFPVVSIDGDIGNGPVTSRLNG
jgi:hypothetical protein